LQVEVRQGYFIGSKSSATAVKRVISDVLVALGRQNGVVIADYVVSRMQSRNTSPAQAVEALAAYLVKRIDELKASGIPEERLMPWVGAVQKSI
jgi:hypothetical protein